MKALKAYLLETFGVTERPQSENETAKKLPLYLKGNYDFYSGHLAGQKVIWAEVKNQESATPDQLKKQSEVLQEFLGHVPVVFVFETLDTWQRKRLIEKKVGFAEPFKQLYIPQLFIQIRESGRKEILFTPVSKILKPPAQYLLLYHLQVEILEEKPFQEIARLMNYSPMTVSRSVRELSALGLLTIDGKSKEKTIRFNERGRALWEKALLNLSSPVRETWYWDHPHKNEYIRFSGEMALAHYSMLSATAQSVYAIGKEAFRLTKTKFKGLDKKYGHHKMEIWHYDPTSLTSISEVDQLSLYLTLKDHEDERVQGALHHMINEMKWL